MSLHERNPRTVATLKDELEDTKEKLKDLPRQAAQMQDLIGLKAFDIGVNGTSYATAVANRKKELRRTGEVQSLFVAQGEKLEGLLDREVAVPEIPSGLLLPDQEIQLTPLLIPNMDDLTPEKMQRILDGEKSPYRDIFPEEYMRQVLQGRLPYPLGEPYIALVDRQVTKRSPETPLSHAAGIGNLAERPIADVRVSLRRDGKNAVKGVHLDPDKNAIKPLSTREAIIANFLEGNSDKITTNSRRFGTDKYVVYDGINGAIDFEHGNNGDTPTRLVVVTRPLVPERYLKKQ